MLDLSPAAHAAWVHAYDHIERQLGGAGHYASIRDVAAKAAENIARLAALLHVLDHGPAGEIDESSVERTSRLIDWHLHEARRLLADLDAPPERAAAIRFDAWLRDEALRTGDLRIASARIQQCGPDACATARPSGPSRPARPSRPRWPCSANAAVRG